MRYLLPLVPLIAPVFLVMELRAPAEQRSSGSIVIWSVLSLIGVWFWYWIFN